MPADKYTRSPGLAELRQIPNTNPEEITAKSLTMDNTHKCPFKCKGCIEQKAMQGSGRASLNLNSACNIISQFVAQGGEELLMYGGEPTSDPNFSKILFHAAGQVKLIRVITNGAYLYEEQVAESIRIASSKTELSVRVSLNSGTPETHAMLHGVKGYFPRIVNGMKQIAGSCHLGVSYLLEEANASELYQGYKVAEYVGAKDFWVRPMTGLHGIGIEPLSMKAKESVIQTIEQLKGKSSPNFHVDPWYIKFIKTDEAPDTKKDYPSCFFCASSRLVVTPPDPGIVWACTYWRGDSRFFVADLAKTPFGSEAFEQKRIEAIRRIHPRVDCADVICNRNSINKYVWKIFNSKVMVA